MASTEMRQQLAAVRADIAQQEQTALAQWAAAQRRKLDLTGLWWAAEAEEALEFAEEDLERRAVTLDEEAARCETGAAEKRSRGGRLEPSRRRLRRLEGAVVRFEREADEIGERRTRAAVSGGSDRELAELEARRVKVLADLAEVENELSELRARAAEAERLRVEATGDEDQARVLRAEAYRLRTEGITALPEAVAEQVARARDQEARQRELAGRVEPAKPLSSADLVVPATPTIEVGPDGQLVGVAGLVTQ